MPNVIASGTTVSNGTIKRNNFLIGVNTSVQYGPTSATTFWNGVVPPTSGYTVYAQKTVNGPSIRTAANDSELITISRQYGGTNITTVNDALNYFNGQSNFLVTNIDYPSIVTSGSVLNVDAGYVPSYPRSGTTWTDLSGQGNNATMVNTPVFSTSNNGIFTFNGTNNYFTLGTPASLNLTSTLTVNSWVRLTAFPSNDGTFAIYAKGFDSTNEQFYLRIYNFNSINYVQVGTYNQTARESGTAYTITGGSITTNTWCNLIGQFNGSAWIIYLNGSNVSQTNTSQGPYSSTSPSTIGAEFIFPSYQRFLNGSIGSIQVYNRVLSETEILQNYNATKSRFGL